MAKLVKKVYLSKNSPTVGESIRVRAQLSERSPEVQGEVPGECRDEDPVVLTVEHVRREPRGSVHQGDRLACASPSEDAHRAARMHLHQFPLRRVQEDPPLLQRSIEDRLEAPIIR